MKIILSIPFYLICFSVFSQSFAPDGAQWRYNITTQLEYHIQEVNVIGDTVVQGRTCRLLKKQSIHRAHPEAEILYGDTDWEIIYVDDEENTVSFFDDNRFNLLYDFKLEPGMTWEISAPSDENCNKTSAIYRIDSIKTEYLNGIPFKLQYASKINGPKFFSQFLLINERIGHLGYMFPVTFCYWADLFFGGGLICYRDTEVGLYDNNHPTPCNVFSSFDDDLKLEDMNVYPNPISEYLTIEFPLIVKNCSIDIVDVFGNKVWERHFDVISNSETIHISHYPKGVYFVRVVVDNQYQEVRKIVKQ